MTKPVFIGGIRYVYSTPKRVDRADSWGEASYKGKSLKVKKNNGQNMLPTLVHEIIHACQYEHSEHVTLRGMDERDVDVLAKEISGALRQLGFVK
jgi:hypothetical protein